MDDVLGQSVIAKEGSAEKFEVSDPGPKLQISLPNSMPEAWIEQLRDTRKDKLRVLLTSLITSTVIAALITGFVNYRLESFKKQAALDLEAYKKPIAVQIEEEKIKLQTRNAHLATRKTTYDGIKMNFLKFIFDLEQYVLALEAAFQTKGDENFLKFSQQKLDALVNQMTVITTAPKNDEFKELDERVDEILEKTNLTLKEIGSPQDCSKLKNQYESVIKPMIEEVKKLLDAKEKSLVL